MNHSELVAWIHGWLTNNDYEIEGELGPQKVTDVIDSSLDVVELTMDLEEVIGAGDEEVDLEELAPKFAVLSFDELAAEILRRTGGG